MTNCTFSDTLNIDPFRIVDPGKFSHEPKSTFQAACGIEPSDSLFFRCCQMIHETALRVIEWLRGIDYQSSITQESVAKKLESYQIHFESKGSIPIEDTLTPRECFLLRKAPFSNQFKDSPALQLARKTILNEIPDGISIFVTSRLTHRLIQEKRFDLADVFRYIGGSDLKHIGFVIKNDEELRISCMSPEHGAEIKEVQDPLFLAHSLVLQMSLTSLDKETQKIFRNTLLEEALTPRTNIPSMGGWVFLPFFFGHKRLISCQNDSDDFIELKSGQREMCSSFVAKIILKALKKAAIPSPVPSDEILERMHILRFFSFFSPYVQTFSFSSIIQNAFPSPTQFLNRFVRE